jgi:hypothetical protein
MTIYVLSGCAVFHVEGTILGGKNVCNIECVLHFLCNFYLKPFYIKEELSNIYIYKTYRGLHTELPKFMSILANLEISPKILIQVPNIKFHYNTFSRRHTVPHRQMDSHDKASNQFLQLCERAYDI